MDFKMGDVVRDRKRIGLYEIVSNHSFASCKIMVTDDECSSEVVAFKNDLRLVCRFEDRLDVDK